MTVNGRDETNLNATKPICAFDANLLKRMPGKFLHKETPGTGATSQFLGAHKGTSMAFTASNNGGCKFLVATVLALGMLTTGALAHTAEQEQMCTADAMRLCSSEIPDVDRITACMHRQRAALSDGCKAVFRKETPAATPVSYAPAKPGKPINLAPTRVK
ncbi:MAG: hypothetical protein Q8K88_09240 [Bradyrhizobium sp.]|nr:hypothetical protein [Bradyrhizobium sp.]